MPRVCKEIPWIVIMEDGDTPESLARWIEQNVTTNADGTIGYQIGDVNTEGWAADPKPGDAVVFNSPASRMTVRFPGYVMSVPNLTVEKREEIASEYTSKWGENGLSVVVNMLTSRRKKNVRKK